MDGTGMLELSRVLPVPGPLWGRCPMRAENDRAPPWRRPYRGSAAAQCRALARRAAAHAESFAQLPLAQRATALAALRRALRHDGLRPPVMAQALGAAAAVAAETLGWTARPSQHIAAAALLSNHLAEMATGEGKTLSIALAAAVAALAGVPVHVVTANPYLAGRDAARLVPFFAALGLQADALQPGQADTERRAVYAGDVVYAALLVPSNQEADDLRAGVADVITAAAFAGRSTPAWFSQGAGRATAGRIAPKALVVQQWRRDAVAALPRLGSTADFLAGHADPATTALAAGGLLSTLATGGKLGQVADALDGGATFDEAFLKVFRATPAQAFEKWAARARR